MNDHFLSGPDLLNNLVGVLLRFVEGKCAALSDIEQMFHQINVTPEDQDALRFLWQDGKTDAIEDHIMCVQVFGKMDSSCIANRTLKRTARDSEKVVIENIIDQINRNFYMDDFLSSHSSIERLSSTAKTIIEVLSNGGFRLTKWLSNNKSFLDTLLYSEISPKVSENQAQTEELLGILWNFETDLLSIKPIDKVFEDTKRGMLAFISSLLDPFGTLTPFTLEPKLLIQELWRQKLEWDEIIPRDILQRWNKWKVSFNQIQSINIPRWYGFH